MDLVHENSISAISVIQSSFTQQKSLMFLLSNVFDPRYAFLFYSPLIFSLNRYAGRKLMWVAVMAEWSNQILKWIMHGERPYWWIHETNVYNKTGETRLPAIEQYFMTCETGPGSPSGHAMVTAAVWYILIEAFLRQKGTLTKRSIVNRLCWSIYTIGLCAVSLSRIYLAAHFPHQCALGMVIGVAVAMLVSHLDTDSVTRKQYIWGTIGLFASAMATYALLKMMGFNPMWSVERALKWCAKREHIHLDTTPFFSIMRYTGFFLGMGLALHSNLYRMATKDVFSTSMKISAAVLSVGFAKATEFIPMPKHNVTLCYAIAFLMSAVLPYVFIAIIPYIVSKFSLKSNQKTKSN
ncbi:glucose-6-phosphatase 2-like [Oppia nitens]|uniref:glucose-6-phosphatase 2-like n=1 Tax=Oppia nitens TaxID=1686743 RepID=UPI0023DB71CA|nr:glucose-6-phosphatase 2-like [Oppia nitens]